MLGTGIKGRGMERTSEGKGTKAEGKEGGSERGNGE